MTAWIITALICTTAILSETACLALAESVQGNTAEHIANLLNRDEYVAGEALALVTENCISAQDDRWQTVEIAKVSGSSVQETIEAMLGQDDAAGEVYEALKRTDAQQEEYSICHIVDHTRSTKELLVELYSDPDVIAAEPNYTAEMTESEEDGSHYEAEVYQKTNKIMPGDLSDQQWDLGKTADRQYSTPSASSDDYCLNPPGWEAGHNDPDAEANSSGTICIMDTGLDVTHPEFEGVLYEFTQEQQERYGCGRYGFNATAASDEGDVGDLTDHGLHGTHVAGIIAANWDGHGISGIVNGAKIFGVRIFADDGMASDEANTLRAFDFLIRCAKEVNLKAVNCSWGHIKPQLLQTILADELGRQGVITVYASGNRSLDVDELPDSGPSNTSIYSITVDGADMNGKIGAYSCYGQTSTDVFAPGSAILSTVPEFVEDGMGTSVFRHFFPELTDPSHLIYGSDHMTGEDSGVRFFDRNPALSDEAREIGTYVTDNGFDDKASVRVDIADLGSTSAPLGTAKAERGSFYIAIPADGEEDVKWLSLKLAVDKGKALCGVATFSCVNENGELAEIDRTAVAALKKGLGAMSQTTAYECQWSMYSTDFDGFMNASNEVHRMSDKQRDEFSELMDYKDPGKITGLYHWMDDGRNYILIEVGVGNTEPGTPEPTCLYVDDIALGDGEVVNGAYVFYPGTSMAAPAVSAALAITARDEEEAQTLDDDETSRQALEREAKLFAAVEYDPDLKDACRTGGRVNLGNLSEKKAPLIERADTDGTKLKLEGYFFGDSGELMIDGQEHDWLSWSEREITADCSDIPGGSHTVQITNAEGVIMQVVVPVSNPESGRMLYENTLSVPLHDPALREDEASFFYGQMAECEGKLYFLSSDEMYDAHSLWCYDPGEDAWSCCGSVPEAIRGQIFSGLAGWQGQVYVMGTVHDDSHSNLWSYDPSTGKWAEHTIKDLPGALGLCPYKGRLFGCGTSMSDENNIWILDLEQNTAAALPNTAVEGTADWGNPRLAATDSCLYVYAPEPGIGDEENPLGMLIRVTYDEDDSTVHIENLTDILVSLIDPARNNHIAIAAGDNYCVIIASAKDGTDTHILYDDSTSAVPYDREAAYHTIYAPMAAMCDGSLYVEGNDQTAPDLIFLRSQKME